MVPQLLRSGCFAESSRLLRKQVRGQGPARRLGFVLCARERDRTQTTALPIEAVVTGHQHLGRYSVGPAVGRRLAVKSIDSCIGGVDRAGHLLAVFRARSDCVRSLSSSCRNSSEARCGTYDHEQRCPVSCAPHPRTHARVRRTEVIKLLAKPCLPLWLITALVLAVGAAPAEGEGAQTVAAAPIVAWGEHYTGNTANGFKDAERVYYSWWNLSVTAGDSVTIDWEAPNYLVGEYPEIHVYPVGTTDFNYKNVPESEYNLQGLNSNGRNELQVAAPKTGTMPMSFISEGGCCSGKVGPYAFTAYVHHAAPPPPLQSPCVITHGSPAHDLLASLKCTAHETTLEVECGVSIAGLLVPLLKSLKVLEAARAISVLDRLPAKLRPIAKFFYHLYHDRYLPGAPSGLRSGAEAVRTFLRLNLGYKIILKLPDLARAVSHTDFNEIALDLATIAGLKSCVHAVSDGQAG